MALPMPIAAAARRLDSLPASISLLAAANSAVATSTLGRPRFATLIHLLWCRAGDTNCPGSARISAGRNRIVLLLRAVPTSGAYPVLAGSTTTWLVAYRRCHTHVGGLPLHVCHFHSAVMV